MPIRRVLIGCSRFNGGQDGGLILGCPTLTRLSASSVISLRSLKFVSQPTRLVSGYQFENFRPLNRTNDRFLARQKVLKFHRQLAGGGSFQGDDVGCSRFGRPFELFVGFDRSEQIVGRTVSLTQ